MTVHVRFHQTFPLRVAEWFLAMVAMVWGLIVASNPGMFQENQSFRAMLNMAPQGVWGWTAATVGAIGLSALTVNGAWRSTPHIRAVCAFMRCLLWAHIITGLSGSGAPTTGLAVYPGMLILEVFNTFRAMADARASDEYARLAKE